jgi:hypothetical protein
MCISKLYVTHLSVDYIVTCFHGNAWVAMVGLVEVVVARQQDKCVCTG